MKRFNLFLVVVIAIACGVSCGGKVDYRKTSSGLLYKLYPGKEKDSLMKPGYAVKFNIVVKLNDSVMADTHGKMPGYAEVVNPEEIRAQYSFIEILPKMRTGDSAVIVQVVDSLRKRGAKVPEGAKDGDRITCYIKVLKVFKDIPTAQVDVDIEMERDRPRMEKERAAEMQKRTEEGTKEMDAYLAAKKITAQKTGKGTRVLVNEQGTLPLAKDGQYIEVKYTGKTLDKDSTFESSVYKFQLGRSQAIPGWDEGLLLFGKGGKGILFIPGYLAYGAGGNGFKPFQAMKFDVEVLRLSDTPFPEEARPVMPPPPPTQKRQQ